jgi:hypothetical protein
MQAWFYFTTGLLYFISTIWNLRLVFSWNIIGGLTEKDVNRGNNLINNILIVVLINITCLSQMFFSNGLFYCRHYPSLPPMICLTRTHTLSVSLLSCSLPVSSIWYKNPGIHFQLIIDCNKLIWFTSLFHLDVAHNITDKNEHLLSI